ncbi:hypothetical protein KCU78_g175, partial [Aureobasidium melanogenum]
MDGMNENLHAMLADSVKLDQAISSLVETKHVHQDSTENRTVSVFPETAVEQERLLTEQGKLQYWRKQAVLFVERLFHENDAISPRPLSTGLIKRDLLPHLEAMILVYSSVGWPRDASDVCVRLLCAGSVYNNMTWKKRMLEKADSIAKNEALTTHSSVMLALRKVKVYRLGGEFDRSSEALRDCQDLFNNNLTAASAYKRAQSGLLAIHEAERFVHLDDHKSAIECLQTFQRQTLAQSPFEIMICLRMWIMECRIRRYVGDLEGCEEKLRMSLEVISENQMFSGLRLETLQELADIYVETNPQAVQNLNSEWPQHYHDSSRLQVADAESLLELGKLDLAEQRFQDLGRTLQDSTKHFCLLRINHLPGRLGCKPGPKRWRYSQTNSVQMDKVEPRL